METRGRGRPVTVDHKNVPHTTIAMPKDRNEAIGRVAEQFGISKHEAMVRCIAIGLAFYGQPL